MNAQKKELKEESVSDENPYVLGRRASMLSCYVEPHKNTPKAKEEEKKKSKAVRVLKKLFGF